MKLLFVVSGNVQPFNIAPFVKAQGDAIIERGVQLSYFRIEGKGLKNYCKSIYYLRKHLKRNKVDIMHAHYSLSGWVAVLATRKTPVVLSLMGDDAQGAFMGVKRLNSAAVFLCCLPGLFNHL